MSLAPGLWNFCIVAEGFPHDFCPAEVARLVSSKTGAAVDKIAPSPSADSTSPIWLVYLHSHDDQKRCLHHHRTFTVTLNEASYQIKLDIPHMSFNCSELDWIVVDKEERMESFTSEDMFGSGGAGSADRNDTRRDSGQHGSTGAQGYPQHPGYPGGPGFERQYPQPMEEEQYPHYPHYPPHGYTQGPLDPLAQQGLARYPHGSDPSLQEPGARYPTAGPSLQQHPQQQSGRGRGVLLFQQQQQQQGQFFNPGHQAYPTGGRNRPSLGETEGLRQGMGELNLRQEPFPHYRSFENQPEDFYGDSIDSAERDGQFQSDFVVLGTSSPEEGPEQHHTFYLEVTDLPDNITPAELEQFFQDRRASGGGPVFDIKYSHSTRSAAVYFMDPDAIERILKKTPLLLKDKKITVKAASAEQKEAEAEIKTVEIRGLSSEEDVELCTLYFENPKKGGGDIENHQWDDEEKILYITFTEADVAKSVVSKGHTVGGNVLEVALFTPPAEDEEEEMQPQCTVEVRGFDPTKVDLYEMYFSNPKKGGDTITNLSVSEDESVMLITFEMPEVAERVANLPHTVGGRQLEVIVAPPEDPTPPSKVIVKGCDLTNIELYEFYFENPKKGGGDITDLTVDENEQAIIITFEDPEVAQEVCSRQHNVGGRALDVSMYTPKKAAPKRQRSQEPAAEEEEAAPLKTVVFPISQETAAISEDTYILYFENQRRGGGEVDSMEIDKEKGLVYVTFEEAEVAERVASRTHTISGHPLDVRLYEPPKPRPTYPNKLLFKNIADSTTRDCLCMYLERITKLEPADVLYGDEVGTVLVSFDEEPDLAETQKFCSKRKLEGRQLTVSKVPISNCLLVENLSNRTTEDTIELYFENKRSGGGAVEKVEMVPGDGKCFVFFEDHQVLDEVLQKPHKIDGAQLVVKRYMECLGQSGGSQDPTAFTMPKPVTMGDVSPFILAFLRQSQEAKAALLQQLSGSHTEVKFEGNTLTLECTLKPSVPKARIVARTWATDVQQAAGEYLGMIDVLKRRVVQQIWPEVEKAVTAANISSPKGATLFTVPEETAFVVVGIKSMAKELYTKVDAVAAQVEEDIERKSREVTETNSKLEPYKLRLLLAMGFQVEAGKRHEGLRLDISIKKNQIVFHGLLKDVKEAQVEMYETLQSVKDDKIVDMSDMQKKVLDSKETKPFIVQKFKAEKIAAVWEVGPKGDVKVYAFNDNNLVQAIHIIKKSVPEHISQLTPESSDLLLSQDWQTLVSRLTQSHAGLLLIAPSHDRQQVFVTCIDSIMHGVLEEVELFLETNTVYSQVVRFSPSRQRFILQYWQQKLTAVQTSLRTYRVMITMKEAERELLVRGTNQGLMEVRKKLEEINSQIICHVETFRDSGKVKFLSSGNITKDLKMLGQTNHSVVALEPESPDLQVEQTGSQVVVKTAQDNSDLDTLASVQLPNSGVTVSVVKGDITTLPVDAIVNAANNRMDHIGGLARDIVDKGGQVIQDECHQILKARGHQLSEGDVLMSGAGRLSCKAVIHAVGPVFHGGYSGEEDCLHDTVLKCMSKAADQGFTSIAFPAISTGIFRYPPKEATVVITKAVKAYFESHRKSTITSVYLCHLTADIADMFTAAINKVFPSARSTSTVTRKPLPHPRTVAYSPTAKGSGGRAGHRVIQVDVVPGEIAKQKADVIINSTSNGLDLQNGAVSSSILSIAGAGLQGECRMRYPKGIQTGEIAQTGGHGLQCREVYHVALCNWSNPNAQQTLGATMVKCLTEASKRHYKSVAFPVLGTGNLGYPADIVAQTMLGAVDQFQQSTPSTSLRNVSIVIYPKDTKNLNEFQAAQSKMKGGLTFTTQTSSPRQTGSRQKRRFSTEGQNRPQSGPQTGRASGASAEFEIGSLRLIIKQGDITEEKADAIVNSSNGQLDLSRGNVASALKRKCGEQLVKECESKVKEIQQKGVATTRAYIPNIKMIVHVDAEQFSTNWNEGIRLCLKEAESVGARTLAMPALGTGAYGQTPHQAATALFDTVMKFSTKPRSLQELRVVLFDYKMIPPFVGAIEHMGDKHKQANTGGIMNWVKSVVGGSAPSVNKTYSAPAVEQEASLYIYTDSQSNIRGVLTSFDDLVKDRFIRKEIPDEILLTLDEAELEPIYAVQQQCKVEISVRKALGKVVIDGLHNDVFEAWQKISKILRDIDRRRQELQSASMLANMVQWSFLEVTNTGTESKDYGHRENQIIEQAYQGKKKAAEITDLDGNVFVIDFDSMMEYPRSDPSDSVQVLRRDKVKEMASGSLPDNWAAHSANEHVKVVSLSSSHAEYKKVEANFRATLGGNRGNPTITAIDRIQNRTLYQQYIAKKAHLEKQNPGIENEKTLWHGTASDAVDNINNYGFNRSYCGKNATMYGQGVYFAVNTNYSTHPTYSPADPAGNRRIFQCRVLAGYPVKGDQSLRVLPPRQGPILYDSATDDPNNPSMFVIFNDTQAYPEYMVTFK